MLKEIPLSLIDPNPFRDFTLFPIDQDQIDRIVNSIEESGFWTGLRGRLKPGSKDRVELAYGHHRLVAANKAKRATLSIDITSISDDEMVFLLTAENAVQRADHAAASLDAVAAICRRIIYHLMGGGLGTLRPETPRWAENGHAIDVMKGHLEAGAGIGWIVISSYCRGTLPERDIRSAIGALKESGRFTRIIEETERQIDRERKAAAAALEAEGKRVEAEKAKQKAKAEKEQAEKTVAANKAKNPDIFDIRCVQLFKNRHQADAFRRGVTSAHMHEVLPLKEQLPLARSIIKQAKEADREPTAEFIRMCIGSVAVAGFGAKKEAIKHAREANDEIAIRDAFNHFRYAESEWRKGVEIMLDVADRRASIGTGLEVRFVQYWQLIAQAARKVAASYDIRLDGSTLRRADGRAVAGKPVVLLEGRVSK